MAETTTTPATTPVEAAPEKSMMKNILMWVISLAVLALIIYVASRAWKKGQVAPTA